MIILTVETSGRSSSVAITSDGSLVAERTSQAKTLTHSEKLMPQIETLLRESGLGIGEIDIFAASGGPGSFTGLRIGITCVKTLAYASGKPVVCVPTLDILAMNAVSAGYPVCAVMDARNGQVYSAVFHFKENIPVPEGDYSAGHIDELGGRLKENKAEKIILVGSGAGMHLDRLAELTGGRCVAGGPGSWIPRASMAGFLAFQLAKSGQSINAEDLVPLYVRKPQAERRDE
jgi:tRNA threonylcarbamoyladenosine biosynthesis protein TsaB